jgi:hypothetical protein
MSLDELQRLHESLTRVIAAARLEPASGADEG